MNLDATKMPPRRGCLGRLASGHPSLERERTHALQDAVALNHLAVVPKTDTTQAESTDVDESCLRWLRKGIQDVPIEVCG